MALLPGMLLLEIPAEVCLLYKALDGPGMDRRGSPMALLSGMLLLEIPAEVGLAYGARSAF